MMTPNEAEQAVEHLVYGDDPMAKLRVGFAAFCARHSPESLSVAERQRLLDAYTVGYMDAYEESTEQFKAVQRLKREVR